MLDYKVTKVDLKNNEVDVFTTAMNTESIVEAKNYFNNFNDGCIYFICKLHESGANIYNSVMRIYEGIHTESDLADVFMLMEYCNLNYLKIRSLHFHCSLSYKFLDLEIKALSNCIVSKNDKVIYKSN